jgi:hypothetical protein
VGICEEELDSNYTSLFFGFMKMKRRQQEISRNLDSYPVNECLSEAELIQYRKPVGFGPSLNKCPK